MTALLVENLKLVMLFVLIGCLIGLSQLGGGKLIPVRRKTAHGHRRPASVRL